MKPDPKYFEKAHKSGMPENVSRFYYYNIYRSDQWSRAKEMSSLRKVISSTSYYYLLTFRQMHFNLIPIHPVP